MNFSEWIRKARELGASDLHAEADAAVIVRVRGKLQPLGETSSTMRTCRRWLSGTAWAA